MRNLFLIGVHESGDYVVLGSHGSDTEYRLPIDEAFREAARWHVGFEASSTPAVAMRPAEVQALIRGGASAAEAAERAGWSIDKVHRFDGPVLAERAHMAEQGGQAHVRGHSFGQGVELRRLVEERLAERDIDPAQARWDSRRGEDGQWIVEVRYPAQHQARVATWRFSRTTMTVTALDDEARAITSDESVAKVAQAGPLPEEDRSAAQGLAHRNYTDRDEDDNLVADLRIRSAARIRRRGARRAAGQVPAHPTHEAAEPMGADSHEPPAPSSTDGLADGVDIVELEVTRPHAMHADEELPFDSPATPEVNEDQHGAGEQDQPDQQGTGEPPSPVSTQTAAPPVEPTTSASPVDSASTDSGVETTAADTAKEPSAAEQSTPAPAADQAADSAAAVVSAPRAAARNAPARKRAPARPRKASATKTAAAKSPSATTSGTSGATAAAKPAPRKRASAQSSATKPAATRPRSATSAPAPTKPADGVPASAPANEPAQAQPAAPGTESAASAARASRAKSAGRNRASVPAWDDIMFGAKPGAPTP